MNGVIDSIHRNLGVKTDEPIRKKEKNNSRFSYLLNQNIARIRQEQNEKSKS